MYHRLSPVLYVDADSLFCTVRVFSCVHTGHAMPHGLKAREWSLNVLVH